MNYLIEKLKEEEWLHGPLFFIGLWIVIKFINWLFVEAPFFAWCIIAVFCLVGIYFGGAILIALVEWLRPRHN